jgi:hypothetical protein
MAARQGRADRGQMVIGGWTKVWTRARGETTSGRAVQVVAAEQSRADGRGQIMGEARAGDAAAIESRLFALRVSGRGCAALNPQLSHLAGIWRGRGLAFGGPGQSQISGTGEVWKER